MKLGKDARFERSTIFLYEKAGGELILGDNSYINGGSHIRAEKFNVEIGKNCKIAHNVIMITYYGGDFTAGFREKKNGPIIIEDNVWIGIGAMIRGSVRIGEWAIIGMGAVVTHDVKPYHVVAGNPGKDKGLREDHEEIKKNGWH